VFNPRYEPRRGRLARAFDWLALRRAAVCPSCRNTSTAWICPVCGADLPAEGLGEPVAEAVLLGPAGSGKSTYLAVLAAELERIGQRVGFVVDPADESTRRRLASRYSEPVYGRDGVPPSGTEPTPGFLERHDILRPLTFRIRGAAGQARVSAWLSVFDTAGTDWDQRRDALAQAASFLARGSGLMLVIDPLRMTAVREEIRRRAGRFTAVPGVDDRVDRRPIHLADEIRGLGSLMELAGRAVPLDASVAIVLTKLDVWGQLSDPGTLLAAIAEDGAPGIRWSPALENRVHEESEALLVRWTGETFLQQMDLKFPRHRYFAVSALGEGGGTLPGSAPHPLRPWITRPLLWLLESQGLESVVPVTNLLAPLNVAPAGSP
jgi:hypothetical protein